MRILIVSTFYPPLNSIASLRPYSWAKYWTLEGHEVTVLTTQKNLQNPLNLNLPDPGIELIEIPLPAMFNRLKGNYSSPPPSTQKKSVFGYAKGLILRFFEYLRYQKGIFNACRMPDFSDLVIPSALKEAGKRGTWDVVVSTAGPYSVHIIAQRLKMKGLARKWIADYRDTWSDNYIYPGLFPFNVFEKILERKLMQSADLISTVSQPFADTFASRYGSGKVCVVENGFDPADLEVLPKEPAFPSDGKFRIVHTGSIYLGKRDPSPLFAAIRDISQDPHHAKLLESLEVLFAGPHQSNLQALIDRFQVGPWVKMPGFVTREKSLCMQRDAHVLLFLPWKDQSVDGVMTGKIFEYLFSGTPIMAVGCESLEESQRLILEAQAGRAFFEIGDIKKYLIDRLQQGTKENITPDSLVLKRYHRQALAKKLLEACINAK